MEELRLYVKNLPPDLRDEDIKDHFSQFGDIFNVALKGNYGFFSVKGEPDHLARTLGEYDNRKWNGYLITLQKSEKENFMEKLARERLIEKNIELVNKDGKQKKFKDVDINEDDVKIKAGVPMFSGTKAINDSKDSSTLNKSVKDKKELDVMKSFNEFDSMWADKEENSNFTTYLKGDSHHETSNIKELKSPMTKFEKKLRDDERRRQSLANKAKEKNKQKTVIQSALSNLATPRHNKIIFNDDDDDESSKINLFNDLEGDDEKIVLPTNEHFDGEAGQRLLHLQNQFNNDDRFKLDKRFLGDVDENVKSYPVTEVEMIRYDPTTSLTNKKVDLDHTKAITPKNETLVPLVSKDKFYEVSEGIKTSLQQKGAGFSLLETYGNKNDEIMSPTTFLNNDEKVTKICKRNPTLLDSSDEDEIEIPPKRWEPKINIPFGPRDNFFFSEHDPSFSEAFEFMNKKNSEDATKTAENYDNTRRILRKIFKDQILKRSKKTDMFKKKVGGMKRKANNFKSGANGKKMKQ